MSEISVTPLTQRPAATLAPPVSPLYRAAQEFEAVFLAEMLEHAGLGRTREGFGGGAGEAAFGDMLTREWAESLARRGGVGLAERLVEAFAASGIADD